jgi:UDP-N-acetylmuramoyl-L-alanyl-D-glutamate--2,6-diaminopimelate ligase
MFASARLADVKWAHADVSVLQNCLSSLAVSGLTADSRAVLPGHLFVALPGASADGRRFIADAVERGAAAVLAPEGTVWPPDVPPRPLITHPRPRLALARLAAAHAGVQPKTLVAVTGTNGKTSTVDFLRQLWTLHGVPAASLGTLGLIAPGHVSGGGLTTPDPVALAAIMAELAREGVQHAAIEASSHGLDQFRLDGLAIHAAGFSNLTRDHLDYHGSEQAYRAAKLRLFEDLLSGEGVAVVNADMDARTLDAVLEIAQRRRLVWQSVGEQGTSLRLLRAKPLPHGQLLTIAHSGVERDYEIFLPGRFQADNVLMAAALAQACGVTGALDFLGDLAGVRGRMELVATLPNGAAAYVDYAHTPDALARLLAALRPHTQGRLLCVFGAGGDRDPGKRPLMGETVARLADVAVVTDDNPRGEDPSLIRSAILAACPDAREIADRARAIAAALDMARCGDVVVVAGKGHEQGQTTAGIVKPFDDASTIRRLAGAA